MNGCILHIPSTTAKRADIVTFARRSAARGEYAGETVPTARAARAHRLHRRSEPATDGDCLVEGRTPDGSGEREAHPREPTRIVGTQAGIHVRRGKVHVYAVLAARTRRHLQCRAGLCSR